jgi:hypothetical protein
VKGISKNSVTPSKDQIWESWALRRGANQRDMWHIQKNNSRKFPKSQESFDTKQIWPK